MIALGLYTVAGTWALWVMFIAVMHLRDVRDRWGLTTPQKVTGLPLLVIGYTLDVALRLTLFSALFIRPPALETVSELLAREASRDGGWRWAQAHWWREQLLADFDSTGGHGTPGRQ